MKQIVVLGESHPLPLQVSRSSRNSKCFFQTKNNDKPSELLTAVAHTSNCRISSRIKTPRCQKATGFLRTGAASKTSRFQALFVSVLRFISANSPVVFVLEDVESADAESLELLSTILASRTPITFIFTCRGLEEANPALLNILTNKVRGWFPLVGQLAYAM